MSEVYFQSALSRKELSVRNRTLGVAGYTSSFDEAASVGSIGGVVVLVTEKICHSRFKLREGAIRFRCREDLHPGRGSELVVFPESTELRVLLPLQDAEGSDH